MEFLATVEKTHWQIVIVVSALLIAGLFATATWYLTLGRGRKWAAFLMAGLRCTVLITAAVLLWVVFWGRGWGDEEGELRDTAHLLFLQDASASMEFPGTEEAVRAEIADGVWERLTGRAGRGELAHVKAERFLFGKNVVGDGDAGRLDASASRLHDALLRVVGERPADAVVVVSDGACCGDDGVGVMLDALEQRGVTIHGVLAGDPDVVFPDYAVKELACEKDYPRYVSAEVTVKGRPRKAMVAEFRIDGKVVAEREIDPPRSCAVRFKVPTLEKGWHACAVHMRASPDEITERNNAQYAVFQNCRPEGVWLITGRPSRESAHLIRHLREACEDEVRVTAAGDKKLADVRPEAFVLTVVANVSPEHLPEEVRADLCSGRCNTLFLAGRHLDAWCREGVRGLPIKGAGDVGNLAARHGAPARLDVPGQDDDAMWRERLPVVHVQPVAPIEGAKTLVAARRGQHVHPLLMARSRGSSVSMVLLCVAAWKWDIAYGAQGRRGYAGIVDAVLRTARGTAYGTHALKLDIGQARPYGGVPIQATPAAHVATNGLERVELRIERGGEQGVVELSREGGSWWGSTRGELTADVLWVQAFASVNGESLTSYRKPLLPVECPPELADTDLNPETLDELISGLPDRFAASAEADRVLDGALRQLHDRAATPRSRSMRNTRLERIIALLLLGLLAGEWFVERRVI